MGSVASALATVASAVISKNAAEDAASAESSGYSSALSQLQESLEASLSALEEGLDIIQTSTDEALALGTSYREAGETALEKYQTLLYGDASEQLAILQESPSYQFALSEGLSAIESSAAASSGRLSGGTLKALTEYGQDYATTQYQDLLSNYETLIDVGQTQALSDASTLMTSAATQYSALSDIASTNSTYGVNAANLLVGQGTAEAEGILGVSESTQSLISSLSGLLGTVTGTSTDTTTSDTTSTTTSSSDAATTLASLLANNLNSYQYSTLTQGSY